VALVHPSCSEILTELIGQPLLMLESVVKLLAYNKFLCGFVILDEIKSL